MASMDSHVYSADIRRHGWTGDVTPLAGVALRISWGPDGGASTAAGPLAPLAPCRMVLAVRDARPGRLAEMVGAPDGAWQLVVKRITGGPGVTGTVARGYLLAETFEDAPYGASSVVTMAFADGLGLLDARAFAGVGIEGRDDGGEGPYWAWWGPRVDVQGARPKSERIAASLARVLGPLGGMPDGEAGGLVTAADWRPWLPGTNVSANTDPLYAVLTQEAAWLDADGGSVSQLAALRGLCSRFGARLFQSGGRWHVVQRGLLARLRGQGVPRHTYAPSAVAPGVASTSTRTLDDLVVDTRYWPQAGPHDAPRRGVTVPVRSVEVDYDFRPDLDQLLFNGSFEIPDTGENGLVDFRARGWKPAAAPNGTPYGGVRRFELSSNVLDGFSPSFGDAYALELLGQSFLNPENVARTYQDVDVFLPSTSAWDLELSAFFITRNAELGRPQRGGVVVAVTRGDGSSVKLKSFPVEMAGPSLTGRSVRLYVERVPGTTGQRSIPAGAVLHFWRGAVGTGTYVGRATLTEDATGGDRMMRADVEIVVTKDQVDEKDVRLIAGDTAEAYLWTAEAVGSLTSGNAPGSSFSPSPSYGGSEAWPFVARLSSVATDLRAVEGTIRVNLIGPPPPSGPGVPLYVDDVSLVVRTGPDGRVASTVSARAVLPAGTPGLDISAGRSALPVGDGPHPASASALHVDADGETYPTAQGASTGWVAGNYETDPTSTGVGIDLLSAREALAQLAGAVTPDAASGGGLERVRTTYLLRGGAVLRPDQVVRHWPLTALALPGITGTRTLYTHAAPRVGGTIEVPAGSGVDYAVTGVTRGGGLFAVDIDRGLEASAAAGTRCAYDVLCWWDAYDWDVPAGAVYYDATALDLCDDTTFAEEVRLGSS